MKRTNFNLLKYFIFAVVISLASCKGDKGDIGPQGPSGANGSNGSNGVANISNTLYTANPGNWNGTSGSYYIDVPVPAITNSDSDAVLVYAEIAGAWWALPTSYLIQPTDNSQFAITDGNVYLYYNYTSAPTVTINFKIVVIPPAAGRPAINYNNYSAVKSAFNLKD